MRILGVESSCDETAAAVVAEGRAVWSNVIASQVELHAEYGGVVPEIASRAHVERMNGVLGRAMAEADVGWGDVDAVAVANRPGLIGALLVGTAAAKAAAWAMGKPVVGVDHVEAHLYSPLLEHGRAGDGWRAEEVFPALGLVVSGGHTSMYRLASPTEVEVVGTTIDDAVGEAYDKAAAILGLGYPGGPAVDERARLGDAGAHAFPVSRLGRGSLDLSFSGLKTALLYAVRGQPLPESRGGKASFERDAGSLSADEVNDFCASFQRAAVKAVVLKLERALEGWGGLGCGGDGGWGERPRSLLVGGGVAANSLLRAELAGLGKRWGLEVRLPAMSYCVDNAAMTAGLAYHAVRARGFDGMELAASPSSVDVRRAGAAGR